MPIKTIIFDQWKVIINHDNGAMYRNLSEFSPLESETFRGKVKNSRLFEKFDRGEIEPREFWEKLSEITGMDLEYGKFKEVFCLHLSRAPQMEGLVKKLSENYEVFLLSSTNPIHQKWAEENCPALDSFDKKILSFEAGNIKPEVDIFKIALNETDSRPEECIYTDDIGKYVETAESLGINGIVFKNKKQLEKELVEMGVNWGAR